MELLNSPYKLAAYKPRIEKGETEDGEKGGTLTLEARCNGSQLAQFFPDQASYEEFEVSLWDSDGNVRHGICGAIPLNHRLVGASVTLALPASKQIMKFDSADVQDLTVEPGEGYLSDVRFKILVHPNDEQGGKLSVSLLGKELGISAVRKASADEAKAAGQQDLTLPVTRGGKKKDTLDEQQDDDAPDSSKTLDEQQAEAAAREKAGESVVPGQKPPQRAKKARDTVQ